MHFSNAYGSIQFLKSCTSNPLKLVTLSVFHNMYAFSWIQCRRARKLKGKIRGPDTMSGTPRCPLNHNFFLHDTLRIDSHGQCLNYKLYSELSLYKERSYKRVTLHLQLNHSYILVMFEWHRQRAFNQLNLINFNQWQKRFVGSKLVVQ